MATVILSTVFIRTLYMDLHFKEVTKEAKGVTEYAKSRFTAYAAFDDLVEYWTGTKLSKPNKERQQNYIKNRDSLMQTDVTAEELEAMDSKERQPYIMSNYAKLSSGFDLIYKTFDVKNLICVKYTADKTTVLFDGHSEDNGESIFKLPEMELPTGVCRTVNAGHENPIVRHGGGEWEILRYPHDMPAAMFRETPYTVRTTQLHDEDMIFVYTDGVTEAVNAADELFGEERITQTLNSLSTNDTKAVIDGLFAEICSFSAGAEQYDDIGMVCFKYHSRKE